MKLLNLLHFAVIVSSNGDQTSVTVSLNSQIESGNGAYNKGKGVMVRTPDFFAGGDTPVVPSSFWVNDIIAISQLYPSGNPWCPHGNWDGYESLSWSKCDFPNGPWEYATVAVVLGDDVMPKFFKDFDKIQESSWGWGVFYATDANAVDKRCKYEKDGWNCPGGWVDSNGDFSSDPRQKGAGAFEMGNPDAGLGGGGAGCHFDSNSNKIDQVDAYGGTDGKQNLVKDANCQCNYVYKNNWNDWVNDWIEHKQEKPTFEWRKWLNGGGKAPSWAVDPTICWVNNPKDMIAMQNAMYRTQGRWNNQMAPTPERGTSHNRNYWGWNEVPVTRKVADDPGSWTAVMIKLPAHLCSYDNQNDHLSCLNQAAETQLEKDLETFVSKGKLLPGDQHIGQRPGSYVVMVREFEVDGSGSYHRQFYCENWSSPSGKYKIVFVPEDPRDTRKTPGACYIEDSSNDITTKKSTTEAPATSDVLV